MNWSMRFLAVGGCIVLCSGLIRATDSEWDESETESSAPNRVPVKASPFNAPLATKPTRRPVPNKPEPRSRNYYSDLFGDSGSLTSEAGQTDRERPAQMSSNKSARKTLQLGVSKSAKKSFSSKSESLDVWPSSEKPVQTAGFEDEPAEPRKAVKPTRVEIRPRVSRIPVPPTRTRTVSLTEEPLPRATAPVAAPQTGPQTAAVSLEWVKKSEFNVGQECRVELVVKNPGSAPVQNVIVDVAIQSPVRLTSANPEPVDHRDHLTWNFPTLAAESEQRIALTMIPARRGELGLQAQVHVLGTATASFHIEEPLLKITLKGPGEVLLGDSAAQTVVVSNPGTGAAHDVKISARLSGGLEHPRGNREDIEMEIGSLTPGESRTIRLPLTGVKPGPQTVSVTATCSADLSPVATTTIKVIAPSLTLSADGPGLRYKGRHAKFTAKVVNDGSVANNNVRIVQQVSDGFQFVSADHGGKFDAAEKTVTWFLGRLEPEQSIQVACELTTTGLGDFTQQISAVSDAGAWSEASVVTRIDGTPSLTMEVADLDDPVEVGVETAYEIRVKNEGSIAASNVIVSCELPEGVELLSAKGPTDARAERRTLIFKPVAHLAPAQEAVFRVSVKGLEDGQHRIQARVSSDSLDEPLLKEEQTKFYSDIRR